MEKAERGEPRTGGEGGEREDAGDEEKRTGGKIKVRS